MGLGTLCVVFFVSLSLSSVKAEPKTDETAVRVCIVNENKKGMLMKITNALAEFNVVKQQNDSRDDIAYNLVRASLVVQVDTTAWTTFSTGVNRNRQDHVELSYSFVGICFFLFSIVFFMLSTTDNAND